MSESMNFVLLLCDITIRLKKSAWHTLNLKQHIHLESVVILVVINVYIPIPIKNENKFNLQIYHTINLT